MSTKMSIKELDYIASLSENVVGASAFIKYGTSLYREGLIKGAVVGTLSGCAGVIIGEVISKKVCRNKLDNIIDKNVKNVER